MSLARPTTVCYARSFIGSVESGYRCDRTPSCGRSRTDFQPTLSLRSLPRWQKVDQKPTSPPRVARGVLGPLAHYVCSRCNRYYLPEPDRRSPQSWSERAKLSRHLLAGRRPARRFVGLSESHAHHERREAPFERLRSFALHPPGTTPTIAPSSLPHRLRNRHLTAASRRRGRPDDSRDPDSILAHRYR